jgi:hypothetical protein
VDGMFFELREKIGCFFLKIIEGEIYQFVRFEGGRIKKIGVRVEISFEW